MSGRFDILHTPIAGLDILQRKPVGDHRGYLERMFCVDDLGEVLAGRTIAQINHTLTLRRGTVRGMHFQSPPHREMKIVSCLRGGVFDVAIDVRRGSPTFLHWHGEVLSAENHRSLVIPEGFAHGFQTLAEDCQMLYLHTAAFQPQAEGALNCRDPRLAIAWPEQITEMSERDEAHALMTEDFSGIDP